MKKFLVLLLVLFSFDLSSQVINDVDTSLEDKLVKKWKTKKFFGNIYDDIFKYATIYVAGDLKTPYTTPRPSYFVRTNPDNLYAIPEIIDNTEYHNFDYRFGFGIRKIALFDYEIKGRNYYDGTENTVALSSPTSAVKGWEYLLHFEKERQRSDEFTNHRLFLRHTGKYHIAKLEFRQEGNIDFEYSSAEARFRLPIGKKFSISVGAIYRSHQKSYGYNPISIWLNETTLVDDGQGGQIEVPSNPWYSLGYEYGYQDFPYTSSVYNPDGTTSEIFNYLWRDAQGNIVAYTDEDFRDRIFGQLMNRFNNEKWDELDGFGEVAPIVGADFYTFTNKFWLHSYVNYILPYHHYVEGEENFSYLHRNSWNMDNYNYETDGRQWEDWQVGLIAGWKISKRVGIFVEGEYARFWDAEIYNSSVGLNFRL